MQTSKNNIRNICAGGAFLLAASLLVFSCGPTKSSTHSNGEHARAKGPFTLQTAMHDADTVRIRQFLAGNWILDRTCRSTFTGLSCDTSIKQSWQLDSLAGISWTTEGDNAGSDKYHFVPRAGAQAGSTKGDSVWVMYLNKARRGYLIRTLTKDSLSLSEYPLIMDNTTTYYLSRQQ